LVPIGWSSPLILHIFFTPHVHPFSKIPFDTWFLVESYFDNLNHHREFDITATSLDLGKEIFEAFKVFFKRFGCFLLTQHYIFSDKSGLMDRVEFLQKGLDEIIL